MLTQELALELKKSGFLVQKIGKKGRMVGLHQYSTDYSNDDKGRLKYFCNDQCLFKDGNSPENLSVGKHNEKYMQHCMEHEFYIPTLKELIEACGEGFETLRNSYKVDEWWTNIKLVTIVDGATGKTTETIEYKTKGSSPEEAVARLWLALNKK